MSLSREIATPRLLLRPFEPGDRARMVAFYGDEAVMGIRKLGVLAPAEAARELERILAHWATHGFGLYAVVERASGEFAGECGLRWLDDEPEVELSYGLLPGFRGRGLATEAARAVLEHGFGELGLERIVALSRGDNRDSHHVLEKCGMRLAWRKPPSEQRPHGLVKYVRRRGEAAMPETARGLGALYGAHADDGAKED